MDPGCGGSLYAHIAYDRQLALKKEIVLDAFQRIGKLPVECPIDTHASPEHGYRMRARLHVHGYRIGFYREATHDLCDPATSRQLLDSTLDVIAGVSKALGDGKIESGAALDLSENVDASERAILLDLRADARERGRWTGCSVSPVRVVWPSPVEADSWPAAATRWCTTSLVRPVAPRTPACASAGMSGPSSRGTDTSCRRSWTAC